ncbi:ergothioneine biosynthesis protein EgtB [Halobacillus trueperi]|uniref:Ergothioneine biosynthesis protein EgtB n=1 Tax=Halobacillus trueperi TaxID=156205 RepID=A0A3D8VE24_9BACI|nr:ergothioneine biosynthesis protein EgtB [Halobacillus trueperi]RDY67600.1 ergothioneine biosynthesis protein EgtB [Halobacillus trueperi]
MPITESEQVIKSFQEVRKSTKQLVSHLQTEDFLLQASTHVSPTKWHLAHTTWFFEKFILEDYIQGYQHFNPVFLYLFNSYYETVGTPHPQAKRGLISRPTVQETMEYRDYVDQRIVEILEKHSQDAGIIDLIEIGLQHEQQHQELILMDIKYNFSFNPFQPVFKVEEFKKAGEASALTFHSFEGGLVEIGHDGDGFSFDNERPRHTTYLHPFQMADRPVTNADYIEFIDDGGYENPQYWLSDGWQMAKEEGWKSPQYWQREEEKWYIFTLGGLQLIDLHAPVCHVSFYEADAYARWAGRRLPTEQEWEFVMSDQGVGGHFMEDGHFHPHSEYAQERFKKAFGDVWEWTRSPYVPYPRSKPLEGALGEYNAKFMANQIVLKGGSCVTPRTHIRPTYRNFFYPQMRWQFSGIRLADDA